MFMTAQESVFTEKNQEPKQAAISVPTKHILYIVAGADVGSICREREFGRIYSFMAEPCTPQSEEAKTIATICRMGVMEQHPILKNAFTTEAQKVLDKHPVDKIGTFGKRYDQLDKWAAKEQTRLGLDDTIKIEPMPKPRCAPKSGRSIANLHCVQLYKYIPD